MSLRQSTVYVIKAEHHLCLHVLALTEQEHEHIGIEPSNIDALKRQPLAQAITVTGNSIG